MLQFRHLAAAFAGILLAAVPLAAQSKVGIVNLQKALQDTQEIKQAEADLKAKYGPRQEQLAKLEKEIQAIQADYDKNAAKYTEQALSELQMQAQRKQRDYQRMAQLLQDDVNRERQDVLQRSGQRLQEVIKKISEEKGFDMVIDMSNLLFSKPALDLSGEVTAAYDKAYPVKK